MMTAHGSLENHVECMKEGAFIYVMKPFSPDEIEMVIEKALDYQRLSVENRQLRSELESRYNLGSLIGRSPCMEEVLELVRTVAASRSTALVTGESGTGKELVARAIHYNSPRKDGPFVTINCAALPKELIESELFGHEKGAFTSAIRQTRGRFELADGGTLLLDEISEIYLPLQAKLLRVLQEREFERVGGHEIIKVDVRIVATTNRDLPKEVQKGRFREDLFYRLNVIPIQIPPLRDRKDDIPALVAHFLEKYARENGKTVAGISE
ncbi:sigma-54-dependent Fis family transcriptional regulator, partial [bacterium]|nr:sigma-54-dependent Fis family transcriptional regulator [bacterium]